MKKLTLCLAGLLAALLTASAADLYQVSIGGSCKTSNGLGRVVTRPFTTGVLLRDCAEGDTNVFINVRELRLVYDVQAESLTVVNIVTGETVCDFLLFGEPTVVSNLGGNLQIRHFYLFTAPSVDARAGSLVLTERIVYDREGVEVRRSGSGRFHFTVPAGESSPAQICSGSLSFGRRIILPTPEPPPEP